MATLPLSCGLNDLVVDASASSMTVNSGAAITLNPTTKLVVSGGVQLSGMGTGLASFDGSGNLSSVVGTPFNAAGNQTVTGTWVFSNTATHNAAVQINSTLGVTGVSTLAGSLVNSGISTRASTVAVPTLMPPAGSSYVVVDNTTGQFYKLV